MKPRLNLTSGLAQLALPMNSQASIKRLKHAVNQGSFYHSTEGRVEAKITQGVLKSDKILTTE